ncbi:hypothetical protein [Luteimonas huabeiensis]|uniref:hypothetical protein n=1 Tax=Luteimonas huabeiensis TaxID=1244513 RepID=UPI000466DE18|nr:hypothetical protein [Luteimonas huabeiensis]
MSTASDPAPRAAPNTAGRAAWVCLALAWLAFLLPFPGLGLFVGWPLNLVAFVLAIVAMSARGAGAGLWPLLASLIVSPVVYFIGLAVLAGAIVVGAAESSRQAETARPAASEQAVAIDAQALQAAYDADPARFRGRSLRIEGVVERVAADGAQAPSVWLETGDGSPPLRADGLSAAAAARLSAGQRVVLVCIGAAAASVRDCRID